MASDRKKYVMAAELAIEREMAYRKQLELSCPKQNIKYGENPFSRTQVTQLSIPSVDVNSNSKASVPSSWPEQSLLGSRIPRPNPSPSSSPRPSPGRPLVASPSPSNPFQREARPSIPSKSILSHQGPKARPTCSARPILPPGQRLAPLSPHPYRPQQQGLLPRPKSSASGSIARPSPPPIRLTLLPTPYPGPRPNPNSGPIIILKRKEAPQLNHTDHGKPNKLFCNVCEVHCSSASNLKMHLQGQKHQAKVNQIQGVGKINGQVYCELCGIWCMNEFNYKQHLSGKNHTLKLRAAEKIEQVKA
ncbi:hypothetical protein Cgig2_017813 [Carnegiea gigantea]|uniref:C2H2-type domain-containing protein n=1 Tax=Carnegiea gigantea TaxID=171969 RepID=A0A9Q1QR30_9CARY|nr:hypothetical protein Cgig2_017813 [Carnegiea gigantea]